MSYAHSMLRIACVALALLLLGCPSVVAKPTPCPKAPKVTTDPTGPVPAALDGHYEVLEIKPKGHDAAPPETYLLQPDEQKKCAYLRIVLSFDGSRLDMLYDVLCVEPEDRKKNPVPLKWCSTQGSAHVLWEQNAFELAAASGSRSNMQQIFSYAPGSTPDAISHERVVWGCKFALGAMRFEIVERIRDKVRLRVADIGAEWVLKKTDQQHVDPDDVVQAIQGMLHPSQ